MFGFEVPIELKLYVQGYGIVSLYSNFGLEAGSGILQ